MILSKEARDVLITGVASQEFGTEIANAIDSANTFPWKTSKTTLTAAQINALNVTPVRLVPPVSKAIIQPFVFMMVYRYGTIPFTIGGATQFRVQYEGSPTILIGTAPGVGFINQSSSQTEGSHVGQYTVKANEGVDLFVSAPIASGDGELDVYVFYNVLG